MSEPVPYTVTASSADAVITIPAVTDTVLELSQVTFGYDAAPTNGKITIESPLGTTLLQVPVTAAGPGVINFPDGLAGAKEADIIITLANGGANGYVNAIQRR